MKLAKIALSVGFLFSLNLLSAQEFITNPGGCAVTGKSDWFKWYVQNVKPLAGDRSGDTTWLYVPVTIHILGTNNGTGYWPAQNALRVLCDMNAQFAPSYIRFYFHEDEPITYINNTAWYDHDDWGPGSDMINQTKLPGRVNAYAVEDPAGNCGYSSWEGGIVMAKSCSGIGNTTWAHEMGHHLSLPHPFYGWEGRSWDYGQAAPEDWDGLPVEKLDSSNCHDAGDNFCDTRADYLNYRWNCNGNKESNVVLHDPNDVAFRADATIIMGYALDECASRFSQEQTDAMRANLNDEHLEYLQVFEEGPMLDDSLQVNLLSPLDTQIVQYNNIKLTWNQVPDANIYIVDISNKANFPFNFSSKLVLHGDTTLTITKNIPNANVLYWRVKAFSNWDVCQPNLEYQVGIMKTANLSATNDLERVAVVELSPNPVVAGGIAQLSIGSAETFDGRLQLTNAAGQILLSKNIRIFTGENQFEIETSQVSPGFYLVSVETAKGTIVKRLAVVE